MARPETLRLRSSQALSPIFSASDRLEEFVIGLFPQQGLQMEALDPQFLSWATTMRGLKTFDAVLLLADAGYGQQAMMLARTLFEDCVVARWCAGQPQAALLERITAHEKSVAVRVQTEHSAREEFELLADIPTLTAEATAQAVRDLEIDERAATRHWTGQSVAAMVRSIEPQLTDVERAVLRQLFDVAYLLTNLVVHHSSMSLGSALTTGQFADGRRTNTFSRRPATTLVRDALVVSYHSLSLLASLVVNDRRRIELDGLLERDRPVLRLLRDGADVSRRNEPCPCGSGRKVKHCHGRRA